jgi:hypothetical protein
MRAYSPLLLWLFSSLGCHQQFENTSRTQLQRLPVFSFLLFTIFAQTSLTAHLRSKLVWSWCSLDLVSIPLL